MVNHPEGEADQWPHYITAIGGGGGSFVFLLAVPPFERRFTLFDCHSISGGGRIGFINTTLPRTHREARMRLGYAVLKVRATEGCSAA
jgi:hypothetical protein